LGELNGKTAKGQTANQGQVDAFEYPCAFVQIRGQALISPEQKKLTTDVH
jgi:hypothetical protein